MMHFIEFAEILIRSLVLGQRLRPTYFLIPELAEQMNSVSLKLDPLFCHMWPPPDEIKIGEYFGSILLPVTADDDG